MDYSNSSLPRGQVKKRMAITAMDLLFFLFFDNSSKQKDYRHYNWVFYLIKVFFFAKPKGGKKIAFDRQYFEESVR